MQVLTAAPRDTLTAAQVRALLTADDVTVTAGLELLDGSNVIVEDISDALVSGQVERQNKADVHGTCRLVIEQELAWGKDRVRPYMILASGGVSARFNLGVFVLTSPDSVRGLDPAAFTVSGFDLLHLLQAPVGDTYVVAAGTTYLAAVQGALAASGSGGNLLIDGTLQDTVLPATMVWALTPTDPATWLRIINDLLAAISYRGLWVDQDGSFRSGPYATPASRAVEWTFNTSDTGTDLIGQTRTLASDVWAAKNWWRFVRRGMTTTPVEGDGIYTVTNASSGRTSIAALGRTVRAAVQYLDAADQAALVAQGDEIVNNDQATSRTFTIEVDPLPIAGHCDIIQLVDAGDTDKCQAVSWIINLDGSPGRWILEAANG